MLLSAETMHPTAKARYGETVETSKPCGDSVPSATIIG